MDKKYYYGILGENTKNMKKQKISSEMLRDRLGATDVINVPYASIELSKKDSNLHLVHKKVSSPFQIAKRVANVLAIKLP